MASIRFKRGTRAQLDAAATAGQLQQAEPYYVTDENTLAVGSGTDAAVNVLTASGALRVEVVSALPGTPDSNTIYLVTG
jgi:hypothetical protein